MHHNNDEINLRELFSILWLGKWWIIIISFIFAVGSVFYALSLPNEYKSEVIVKAVNKEGGNSLMSLSSQLGGIASLAGVNLGAGESSDAVVAMEIIKTWSFAESFIYEYQLQVPIFAAKGWNPSSKKIIVDAELYNEESQKWIRNPPKGKTIEPTSWELYQKYKDNVSINQNKETGLIKIGVSHYSPHFAKKWVELLVKKINAHMKESALQASNKSIKYLESQIAKTSVAEIRAVFSQLIQEQHKKKMLAQVSDEYVFKTISNAKIAEQKVKPKRAIICIAGTMVGFFIAVIFVLFNFFFRKSKSSLNM